LIAISHGCRARCLLSSPLRGREAWTDELPWIASYGVCLKIANNSVNTYPPLVLPALRKTEKELPIKRASLEKIQNPPPKNLLPQIGNIALTAWIDRSLAAFG
jgi:hypothetical protein